MAVYAHVYARVFALVYVHVYTPAENVAVAYEELNDAIDVYLGQFMAVPNACTHAFSTHALTHPAALLRPALRAVQRLQYQHMHTGVPSWLPVQQGSCTSTLRDPDQDTIRLLSSTFDQCFQQVETAPWIFPISGAVKGVVEKTAASGSTLNRDSGAATASSRNEGA